MSELQNASEKLREIERYWDAVVCLPPGLWNLLDAATKRDTERFATAYEALGDYRKGVSKATRGREILLEAGIGPQEYCGRQGRVFADIADSLAAEIEAQIGDFPQERTSAGLQARDGLVVCRLLSVRELADLVRLIARECLEAKKTLGAAGPQTPEGPAVKLSSCPALDRAHPVALQCLQNVFMLTSAGPEWSPPEWPPAYQSKHERLEYSLGVLEGLYRRAHEELRAARVISPRNGVVLNRYGEVFALDIVIELARDVNKMVGAADLAGDGHDRFKHCPACVTTAFLGGNEASCTELETRLKEEYEDAEAALQAGGSEIDGRRLTATPVGGDDGTLKQYLLSWKEILDTLGKKNETEMRRQVRRLNEEYAGPIIFTKRGAQPRVARNRLIEWWIRLEILWMDEAHQAVGKQAAAKMQHPYGRDGDVAPEIRGGHKKRRSDRKPGR